MLTWNDVDGKLLTEISVKNNFTYVKFFGVTSNAVFLRIYAGEHSYDQIEENGVRYIDETLEGDSNFGNDLILKYAESHARQNAPSFLRDMKQLFVPSEEVKK